MTGAARESKSCFDAGQKHAELSVEVRPYCVSDIPSMRIIWNQVVADGRAFPQEEPLRDDCEAAEFFDAQTASAVAEANGEVLGLYILHPNNVGRCGHIANTSYAVSKEARGRHVGAALVTDSLRRAKACGFRVLQFNAVVASNAPALHLYEKLGFTRLGAIPGGFRNIEGAYEDIYPHYFDLTTLD